MRTSLLLTVCRAFVTHVTLKPSQNTRFRVLMCVLQDSLPEPRNEREASTLALAAPEAFSTDATLATSSAALGQRSRRGGTFTWAAMANIGSANSASSYSLPVEAASSAPATGTAATTRYISEYCFRFRVLSYDGVVGVRIGDHDRPWGAMIDVAGQSAGAPVEGGKDDQR